MGADDIKIEDTNMAGVGGAEDHAVRKRASLAEPAWTGCGQAPGVEVWRIEQFKVVKVPERDRGSFYKGDSYIVLKTTKDPESDKLHHDIHFWLGANTSIDEQGTAAYKTVELDDFFDGTATQHREVQECESREFHLIFPHLHYLDGGVESGFHHVGPKDYEARLLQVRKQGKVVQAQQVPLTKASMNTGDCFILDAGEKVYFYHGSEASPFEKQSCVTSAENIATARNGKAKVLNYEDASEDFWALLGGEGPIKSAEEGRPAVRGRASILGGDEASVGEGVLYKLSDDSGKLMFSEVGRGSVSTSMLESTNVYVLDVITDLFIWIGKSASADEKRQAMVATAHHVKNTGRADNCPIKMFKEGKPISDLKWNRVMNN
eukprot:TRINITY_DN55964_c0_g1_i1.p1 TRINITY_DN55964_c0_g1~~TRINITY_DN55964_c0_g1_i1.p1  ORF type:complete len:395 (-),score=103.57 TRINITY_DN55964_c0_g1_i1:128-1258(-)